MSSDQNPCDIRLYWFVNRDPYNGLLQSLYNGVIEFPTGDFFWQGGHELSIESKPSHLWVVPGVQGGPKNNPLTYK